MGLFATHPSCYPTATQQSTIGQQHSYLPTVTIFHRHTYYNRCHIRYSSINEKI